MSAVNENKSKCITAIIVEVHLQVFFFKRKYIFLFHIITEEPLSMSNQTWHLPVKTNLKFARQMSDDWL